MATRLNEAILQTGFAPEKNTPISDPVNLCAECTKPTREYICSWKCQKKRDARSVIRKAGFNLFRESELKDFNWNVDGFYATVRGNKIDLHKFLIDYVSNSKESLMFYSNKSGHGKTHLALGTAKEIIRKRPTRTKVFSWLRFINGLKIAIDFGGGDKLINDIKDTKLVVIDDVTSGNPDKEESYETRILREIIDHRYNLGLQTIITTNLKPENFESKIISRIAEMSTIIEIHGKDYRLRE